MARHYFSRKGYIGSSLSTKEVWVVAEGVSKLILWLVVAGLILAAIGWFIVGVGDYVFGYDKLAYPHKATGFIYYLLAKFFGLLATGPFFAGNAVYALSVTPWVNLNLIMGVVVGVALYGVVLLLFLMLLRMRERVFLAASAILVLPGAISLVYLVLAGVLGWLFQTESNATTKQVTALAVLEQNHDVGGNTSTIPHAPTPEKDVSPPQPSPAVHKSTGESVIPDSKNLPTSQHNPGIVENVEAAAQSGHSSSNNGAPEVIADEWAKCQIAHDWSCAEEKARILIKLLPNDVQVQNLGRRTALAQSIYRCGAVKDLACIEKDGYKLLELEPANDELRNLVIKVSQKRLQSPHQEKNNDSD